MNSGHAQSNFQLIKELKIPDERKCTLQGYGPDFRKSRPFASLRSVQGAAPFASLCGYPCALAGKVHPLRIYTFPARLKPNTVTAGTGVHRQKGDAQELRSGGHRRVCNRYYLLDQSEWVGPQ